MNPTFRFSNIVKYENLDYKNSIIKDLYSITNGHVTVDNLMSENFEIKLGVKQGDPPSSFFYNIYMDELCSTLIEKSTDVP